VIFISLNSTIRIVLDHRGMTRDAAMMEYLKIAQDLDMYGVNVSFWVFILSNSLV
jgi:hypothetical protein